MNFLCAQLSLKILMLLTQDGGGKMTLLTKQF